MSFLLGSDRQGCPVVWDPKRDGDHLWIAGNDDRRMDAAVSDILCIAERTGWVTFDLDGRSPDFVEALDAAEVEARIRLVNKPKLTPCLLCIRRFDLQTNQTLMTVDDIAKFSKHTMIHLLVTANPDMRLTERFDKLNDDGDTFFTEFARLVQTPGGFDLFEPANGEAPIHIPRTLAEVRV